MVDTLVLGTSAKAWEFESLHAHHLKKAITLVIAFFSLSKLETRTPTRQSLVKSSSEERAEAGIPKATWREVELGLKIFRFITLWKVAEGLEISPNN